MVDMLRLMTPGGCGVAMPDMCNVHCCAGCWAVFPMCGTLMMRRRSHVSG